MYTMKILSNKEFDSLPVHITRGSRIDDSLGFADPSTNTAYVRHTAWPELNKYLINHEFDHLVEEMKTDMDENGICHKKKKFFEQVLSPIIMPAIGEANVGAATGIPLVGTLAGTYQANRIAGMSPENAKNATFNTGMSGLGGTVNGVQQFATGKNSNPYAAVGIGAGAGYTGGALREVAHPDQDRKMDASASYDRGESYGQMGADVYGMGSNVYNGDLWSAVNQAGNAYGSYSNNPQYYGSYSTLQDIFSEPGFNVNQLGKALSPYGGTFTGSSAQSPSGMGPGAGGGNIGIMNTGLNQGGIALGAQNTLGGSQGNSPQISNAQGYDGMSNMNFNEMFRGMNF